MRVASLVLFVAACGAPAANDVAESSSDAVTDACDVSTTQVVIGDVATSGEYALSLPAYASSPTSWGAVDDEAVVLEIGTTVRGFVGHLVLHQGATRFAYGMHLGWVTAGDQVWAKVSPLTARHARPVACRGVATLTPASALGSAGEGLAHAPIYEWPIEKAFDDLPVLVGWSQARKEYQTFFTNENGGTAEICGGGASGMQAEIARWGRSFDVEGDYSYGGVVKFERCTGTVGVDSVPLRMEGAHPHLYYGDGHNRVFESRGGYGRTCGTGAPEKAEGDLAGWNVASPGDDEAHDRPFTIVLRPVPVALDPLGYPAFGGRREGAPDTYAPWLYALTSLELAREKKIDGTRVADVARYLFVDVHAVDVGGSGDGLCSSDPIERWLGLHRVSGGFVLRALTRDGKTHDGTRMTADYFGGENAWKRIAIPLGGAYAASDVTAVVFDAYDGDGIHLLEIGDVFMPVVSGNGATLARVHQGREAIGVYVDDDGSGCSGGMNGGHACVGSAYRIDL